MRRRRSRRKRRGKRGRGRRKGSLLLEKGRSVFCLLAEICISKKNTLGNCM
jgi:hypothetical protein